MSSCYIFCESAEQAEHIHEFLHEPLRKLVWKTGWYINVHAFDAWTIQVMIHDKGWKNRYFIKDSYINMSLMLEAAESKILELISKKPKPLISDRTFDLIADGKVKIMTWKEYQEWKYGGNKIK